MIRVNNRVLQVAGKQRKESQKDGAAMAVGMIVFWPALFFLIGDDKKDELARLKGEAVALEKIAIQKECNIATELEEARKQQEDNKDEESVSGIAQGEDLKQESSEPIIEIKSADHAQHPADQADRLKSFLSFYCQAYESKDLEKFTSFFAHDALEENKPFHELLPQYRKNMEMIESLNYRIELVAYSLQLDTGNVKIKGKSFARLKLHRGTLKENSGNISMELVESGDSYLIKRLYYTPQSTKKVEKQSQWGPWKEIED